MSVTASLCTDVSISSGMLQPFCFIIFVSYLILLKDRGMLYLLPAPPLWIQVPNKKNLGGEVVALAEWVEDVALEGQPM